MPDIFTLAKRSAVMAAIRRLGPFLGEEVGGLRSGFRLVVSRA